MASVIACAGVTTAVVINLSESLWLGIAAGLLLGALSGLVNGFVIARLKINALITTLATMQIVRGLAYIISDGKAVGIEDERFFTLGYANWFGLPAPIWLTVACLVVFGLLLNKTTFGRNTLAIGGNEEAARGRRPGGTHQDYYLCALRSGIGRSGDHSGVADDQRPADDLDWL
ncbi:hypothetical protein KPZU09_01510 [Klebsiella pneumoniae]|uniref:L-arabinose transporter permease protein n=1 Tax=Klebsiella pneumoniae TaxID=573 RepID=A0A919HMS1_KLEPN|nr:hypothetical protein KPZU09_01510 [Klebsiella pneumoniae]